MPILTYKTKPDEWQDTVVCQCTCLDHSHKLTFDRFWWIDKDGKENSENISVYISPPNGLSWFGKLRVAFRYLFLGHKIYYSNDILFDKDNIEQLEEAVAWIKRTKNETE